MDGRHEGMEDTSQNLVCGASVPTIHHSWCALVLHEWGQHRARLARVDEKNLSEAVL